MDSNNGVLLWFGGLDGAERIEIMCSLFNCCCPVELRFFVTYLMGLSRVDKFKLQNMDETVNNFSASSIWTNLEDAMTRSKLILSLVFLRVYNVSGAKAIYEFLVENFRGEKFSWEKLFSYKNAQRQTELLLTLAANHPAFSFTQKNYFIELLSCLKQEFPEQGEKHNPNGLQQEPFASSASVGNVNGVLHNYLLCAPSNESVNGVPQEEVLVSSSSVDSTNVVSQEEPLASSASRHSINGLPQEELLVSSSSRHSINGLPQEELLVSSSSTASINVVPQDEPLVSSSSTESINRVSLRKSSAFSSLKENINKLLQEKPLASSPAKNLNVLLHRELSGPNKTSNVVLQEEALVSSSSIECANQVCDQEPLASSPSTKGATKMLQNESCAFNSKKGNLTGTPDEELSISSQSKENKAGVLPKKQSLSSPLRENANVSHRKSSSLDAEKSVTLKASSVTPTLVLGRPAAGRSGQIKKIELKGNGKKKGAYRIEVTWSHGKKTELFKSFKQLKGFQQEVTRLSSDSSLQDVVDKKNSVAGTAPFHEDLVEQYDKIEVFLSDFVTTFPLPVRDHSSVLEFFRPSNAQPPRPILVGQGNLNQAPFIEKPSTTPSPNFHSYRNRNNGRQQPHTFYDRHFRSTPSSRNSVNNCLYSSQKNHGSSNHKSFRQQGNWKFYPPISGGSSTSGSLSESVENSHSSSPVLENPGAAEISRNSCRVFKKNTKTYEESKPLEVKTLLRT